MKCVLCHQSKGKRFCPAKNGSICALCCGEKRVLEIDCPESCQYLQKGRVHEAKEYERHLSGLNPLKAEQYTEVLSEHREVVAHLEFVLAHNRLTLRDLTDNDAAEALDLLLDSYRTEGKGILYERRAGNLRVDLLRRELKEAVESHRNPSEERNQGLIDASDDRLHLDAAIACLEYVRDMLAVFDAEEGPALGYVDLLARIIPREGRKPSSLIIP